MYRLGKSGNVIRIADGASIPNNEGNRDWREYQAWITAGNAPTPYAEPPPEVPPSVKMWQAKAALSAVGKLAAADAAVTSAGGAVAIAWEYASDISRNSAAVKAMAEVIGMSESDLDNMFIAANKIII